MSDVTGADLTAVDLTGVALEGVRWSDRTRWPGGTEPLVRRVSVEIAPGLYEIRSGGTWTDINIPVHVR